MSDELWEFALWYHLQACLFFVVLLEYCFYTLWWTSLGWTFGAALDMTTVFFVGSSVATWIHLGGSLPGFDFGVYTYVGGKRIRLRRRR